MPRNRSLRRRNSSNVASSKTDSITRMVATAKMVGEICSRMPEYIWRGIVRCSGPARNRTATTSSNDVIKANSPPDTTPGKIKGIWIFQKVFAGPAPIDAPARTRLLSNPTSVAVTVMITKGVPRAAWARITPI